MPAADYTAADYLAPARTVGRGTIITSLDLGNAAVLIAESDGGWDPVVSFTVNYAGGNRSEHLGCIQGGPELVAAALAVAAETGRRIVPDPSRTVRISEPE